MIAAKIDSYYTMHKKKNKYYCKKYYLAGFVQQKCNFSKIFVLTEVSGFILTPPTPHNPLIYDDSNRICNGSS